MQYYAHSKEESKPENWHLLEDHLESVANMAKDFAAPFGGQEWARLAGLWHDIGKYSHGFQKKLFDANGIECHLETKPGRVIHSQAGGHLAQKVMSHGMERIFCWLIMGHHAGLADFSNESGVRALQPKMRNLGESDKILCNVPSRIKDDRPNPPYPQILTGAQPADVSFLIRMIFSCVVDADFLDTEAFMDKQRFNLRQKRYPSLDKLLLSFDMHVNTLCKNAKPTKINKIRAEVLEQCRNAARKKPEAFSLTVPTGGGKTLSSMAFALRHGVEYGKRRVIYVIPYTSIIEQTASVFREIPGFEQAVVEHHSNISNEDESRESPRSRLATENWDAPIIITTSVQFFESLYACRTSRCRKLHNITNSVVIFDEAQCLPPEYVRPVIFAIRELYRHYGVTPVLCTATQPVLTMTDRFDFKFKEGFRSVTEIIDGPALLATSLKRVQVKSFLNLNPVSNEQMANSIVSGNQSILCIVNRKGDARILASLLPKEQTLHLSTNLCAEHRSERFKEIKHRLKAGGNPLYVISTSLIEAGVDLDFPVVYRALAGLDSIAQAAGRCNREGKLSTGKTIVFVPKDQPNYITSSASLARDYLKDDLLEKLFSPETFQDYFQQRFFQLGEERLDAKGILKLLGGNLTFSFRTASERFQLIDDSGYRSLIVPFGEAPKIVDHLLDWDILGLFRKLQGYTISVPARTLMQLIEQDHARELLPDYPGTYYLHNKKLYSADFGFTPPDELDSYEADSLII